jgi:hypothetical protein
MCAEFSTRVYKCEILVIYVVSCVIYILKLSS